MKVAIVTQFGDNYGNKLQNYALQQLLCSQGHDVKTIIIKDGEKLHNPEDFSAVMKKFSPPYIKAVISSRFKNKYPYKNSRDGIWKSIKLGNSGLIKELNDNRIKAFSRFTERNLRLDDLPYAPGDYHYPDNYDAYVCGSDQIWNPNYASTSSAYFLQFAPERKRIAFAPSFGVSKLPEVVKPLYRQWLNGIPILSVREEKGAEIVKALTGREIPVLPDPTMCLSASDWINVEKRPKCIKKKYVLTYFLGNETNKYRRYIEKYAAQNHCEIINLFDMREPSHYSIDPSEFVWLIHHANAMFTDSFHGTVFSLIFHTPFVVFERAESGGSGMSSRIDTLLKTTGMDNRRFERLPLSRVQCIDFRDSDQSIALRTNEAKQFLQQALYAVKLSKEAEISTLNENLQKTEDNQYYIERVRRYKQDCSGCSSCINVCPVQCIKMVVDEEGFCYPSIDQIRCIHCNKCRLICDEAEREKKVGKEKAYIAFSNNENLRNHSSSGGVFSIIAEKIIEKGGIVYGAGFNRYFEVHHLSVDKKNELINLRGSKYVQSDIGFSFHDIKKSLEQGKIIYFSGTPCQVDGLLAFLGKDYKNLYTQDIICHGVPSPAVWKAYLQLRTSGEIIKSISFRDKTYGWHYFSMKIETEKRKYLKRADEDIYTRLFLNNVILRPSCYSCHHKHEHRKADFTLADCWGSVENLNDDDKGISMVFANTMKAQQLLSEVNNRMIVSELPYCVALLKQEAMLQSVPYNQNRELFFLLAKNNGFKTTIKQWYGWGLPNSIRVNKGYIKYRLHRLINER